jgi:hypothetical protein
LNQHVLSSLFLPWLGKKDPIFTARIQAGSLQTILYMVNDSFFIMRHASFEPLSLEGENTMAGGGNSKI